MVPQTETPRGSRVKMAIWSTRERKVRVAMTYPVRRNEARPYIYKNHRYR